MLVLEFRQPVEAPISGLRERWIAFHANELRSDGRGGVRTVVRRPDGTTRVTTVGRTRRGSIRIEAVVTADDDGGWTVRSETELENQPYAQETGSYRPMIRGAGTELSVVFRLVGRAPRVELAFSVGEAALRTSRSKSLARFAASLSAHP